MAVLIIVGLAVSKSWKFDPSVCGKTFQDAHNFDKNLWMANRFLFLIEIQIKK